MDGTATDLSAVAGNPVHIKHARHTLPVLPDLGWEAKSEIRENILVFAPELINSCDFLSGENTRDIFCSEEILGWLLDGGWSPKTKPWFEGWDFSAPPFTLQRGRVARNVADSWYEEVSIKIPPLFENVLCSYYRFSVCSYCEVLLWQSIYKQDYLKLLVF